METQRYNKETYAAIVAANTTSKIDAGKGTRDDVRDGKTEKNIETDIGVRAREACC
jgi:hypothetical protein